LKEMGSNMRNIYFSSDTASTILHSVHLVPGCSRPSTMQVLFTSFQRGCRKNSGLNGCHSTAAGSPALKFSYSALVRFEIAEMLSAAEGRGGEAEERVMREYNDAMRKRGTKVRVTVFMFGLQVKKICPPKKARN
ncbi:hypothetical protein L9F63_005099, partial [Diploptera punctata]